MITIEQMVDAHNRLHETVNTLRNEIEALRTEVNRLLKKQEYIRDRVVSNRTWRPSRA